MKEKDKIEHHLGDREASISADEIINDIYEGRRDISIEEFIKLAGGEPDAVAEKYPERILFQYGSKVLILNIDREKKYCRR